MRKLCVFFLLMSCFSSFAQSDEPCNATQLFVNTDTCINDVLLQMGSFTHSTSTSAGVTLPLVPCRTNPADAWFKAIVPPSGELRVRVSTYGVYQPGYFDMAFYTSSDPLNCASSVFTQIASNCTNETGGGYMGDNGTIGITINQTPGTVIYVRVWLEVPPTVWGGGFRGRVCALDPPPILPCVTYNYPPDNAVNVSAPGVMLSWSPIQGADMYELYFGTSNPPSSGGFPINSTIFYGFSGSMYNKTYYWYVVPINEAGIPVGCNSPVYKFTTEPTPPVPPNDNCVNAISIMPYSGYTNATTKSATHANNPGEDGEHPCYGAADDDVWFKFTTLQAGNVSITVEPNGVGFGFQGTTVAYSGTCGALTKIACAELNPTEANLIAPHPPYTLQLTGLAAATTYYFRVFSSHADGQQGDFKVRIGGTALPVALKEFKGYLQGEKTILKWITATESNNKGFELQKSRDGRNFETIRFIPSSVNGESSVQTEYSFSDMKPFQGNNYYRLKQVDKDGKFNLSESILVKNKVSLLAITEVYPVPTGNTLNLSVLSPTSEKYTLVFTDIAGKIISSKAGSLNVGDNQIKIDVNHIRDGVYFAKIVTGDREASQLIRFVKY